MPYAKAQMVTPGSFDVSAGGGAGYTIPITIPPGIAGLQPKLALAYSSQGDNGLLGVGWSLAGLSEVTRCPRTTAQDGVHGKVDFTASDRFCLDGERLVLISGTYGANGAEYRTEHDSFTRIISSGSVGGGPASFKTWTKSGVIFEYGTSPDSAIAVYGGSAIRTWAVNRIQDTKGNYLTISYTNDSVNNQFYPLRIDYTANTSVSPPAFGQSVQFFYQGRSDATPFGLAGAMVTTTSRLTNIKTYVGATLVLDYQLAYAYGTATQRSRITSITQCPGSGACLPAISLGWQDATPGISYASAAGTGFGDNVPESYQAGRYWMVDINGDGKPDWVARDSSGGLNAWPAITGGTAFNYASTTGTGFGDNVPDKSGRYFFADINGDGMQDFIARDSNGTLASYLSTGSGFTYVGSTATGYGDNVPDFPKSGRYWMADVDGDGKDDFIARDSTGNIIVYISNGSTFAYAGYAATGFGDNVPDAYGRYFMVDVNGDGRADFVARDSTGNLSTWLSTGTPFSTFSNTGNTATGFGDNVPESPQSGRYWMADVDGDGKPDFIARGSTGDVSTWLSTGDTFTYAGVAATGFGDNVPDADGRYFIADVNGDGRADFIARSSTGGLVTYLSNGLIFVYSSTADTGFGDNVPNAGRYWMVDITGDGKADFMARSSDGYLYIWPAIGSGTAFYYAGSTSTGFGDNVPDNIGRYFSLDVNGDGKADFVARDSNGTLSVWLSNGPAPDLLSTIGNGIGAVTSISYKSIIDGSVYSKDTGGSAATFPVIDLQIPYYVVSSVSSSNGIGGTVESTYTYTGLKLDTTGRGALGFRQMQSTETATGLTVLNTYRQDFPYTGLASQTKKSTSGGLVLEQVDNTLGCSDFNGGCSVVAGSRYFPYVIQSEQSGHDLNSAVLPTTRTQNTFDIYGNATKVIVGTGSGTGGGFVSDGYLKTTDSVFFNDPVAWILGRLIRAQVTNVKP